MMNINSIPEPFRGFLDAGHSTTNATNQKEQQISATGLGIDAGIGTERGRSDMQDMLFLAAILLLCDD